MKILFRIIFSCLCCFAVHHATAQELTDSVQPQLLQDDVTASPKYGYCSFSQILKRQSAYLAAQEQLTKLREQYEREAEYNETDFRRQYSEYLNGQNEFPQAILLKRQRDLQESMEKGLAFRQEADSLLKQAEQDLLTPIYNRINAAIQSVAASRRYEYVIDTDKGAFLYLDPALSEDITTFVEDKLK